MPAHFKVDPKLTQVLGENDTSSEKALRELTTQAAGKSTRLAIPNRRTTYLNTMQAAGLYQP